MSKWKSTKNHWSKTEKREQVLKKVIINLKSDYWKGKKRDEKTLEKLKEGRDKAILENPNYGMRGKKHTEESKSKISKSKKGKKTNRIYLLKEIEECKAVGCKNKERYLKRGYCQKHYMQLLKHGKILLRTNFDANEIIDCGKYSEICLYNKKQEIVAKAIVDSSDIKNVSKFRWTLSRRYAISVKSKISLHQVILGKVEGKEIDHRNHNELDNRKDNLRFVTRSQNNMNRLNVKGYRWHKKNRKWVATIQIDKKRINLGSFANEQEAKNARKKAEQKYFKEFAFIN